VEAGSEPQAEDLAGNEEEEEEKEEGGDDGVRGGEEGSGKLEEAISKWRLVSSTAEKEGSEQPSRLARVHQMSGGKAVVEATGSEPQVTARPRFERVYKGPPSLAAAHATVGVNQMSRRRKVPEAKRSIVSRAMRRMMKRLTWFYVWIELIPDFRWFHIESADTRAVPGNCDCILWKQGAGSDLVWRPVFFCGDILCAWSNDTAPSFNLIKGGHGPWKMLYFASNPSMLEIPSVSARREFE
jgi:hypothetical protein